MSTKYVVIRTEPDRIGAAGINIFGTAEEAHSFLNSEWKRVKSQLPECHGTLCRKTADCGETVRVFDMEGCEEKMHLYSGEDEYVWIVVKATQSETTPCHAVLVFFNDCSLEPIAQFYASKEVAKASMQWAVYLFLRNRKDYPTSFSSKNTLMRDKLLEVLKNKEAHGNAIVEDDRIVIDHGSIYYAWNVFEI